ncbi:MAG: four helix bundle protein [Verrucomicrobia bacterium]|nr:four helix bundle protein [Verrucomicrobiota bacterium]
MNDERPEDLKTRTKRFALQTVRLYSALPGQVVAQVLGRQLLRSGTSVGAHYREAYRAKSRADFISKMEGALQELDEAQYWLELLADSNSIPLKHLQSLLDETDELISIFVTIVKRTKDK